MSWLVVAGSGGAPLGGDTLTGPAADLFALQDRVAAGVATAVGLAAGPAAASSGPKGDMAQERYLAALGHLQKYQDAASVDAAIGSLEKLGTEESAWAPAHAALARAYLAKWALTRDPAWMDRAREACLRAERIDGSLSEVQLTMGRLATESGDPNAAVAAFGKILARQPADVEALLGLSDALLLAGQAGEAGKALRRAQAASPSYWAVPNKLGFVLVSTGRVEEAVAAFRRAVDLAPENARSLVNLGTALVLAGQPEEAADAFRRSIAVAPTAEAYSALATVEYYQGRFDEAVAGYERALTFSPGFPTLWANLGDARRWSSSGRGRAPEAYARAIATANEVLRVNPKDVDAHLAIAASCAKTGKAAQAALHVAAALAAAPENPDVLYQTAVCEAVLGRVHVAADLLRRAERHGAPSWQIEADPELRAVRASPEYRGKPAR